MDFSGFQITDELPLHSQIRDWLQGQLAGYPLEAKLPTDRELAAGLKVAPLTVKRVMGDLEREGFVVRQQGRGTFLASRERRVHAPRQRAAANGEIILAYPNYFSYEYWARAHLTEAEALKAGYGLVELKMNPSSSYEELVDLVKRHPKARGVLIAPVPGSIDRTVFDALDAIGLPVVIFAHCDYLSLGKHVFSVVPDRFKSGYLQVEQFLQAGHRQLAYIANEPAGQDGGEAPKGMRHCLKEHGLAVRDLVCLRRGAQPWQSSVEAAYRLCQNVLRENLATGILVDSLAGVQGVLHCCWELGITVPGQLSLVSGGPPNPYGQFLTPPVTSVYAPYEDEMRLAMSILQEPEKLPVRTLVADVVVQTGQSVAKPNDVPADKELQSCRS